MARSVKRRCFSCKNMSKPEEAPTLKFYAHQSHSGRTLHPIIRSRATNTSRTWSQFMAETRLMWWGAVTPNVRIQRCLFVSYQLVWSHWNGFVVAFSSSLEQREKQHHCKRFERGSTTTLHNFYYRLANLQLDMAEIQVKSTPDSILALFPMLLFVTYVDARRVWICLKIFAMKTSGLSWAFVCHHYKWLFVLT